MDNWLFDTAVEAAIKEANQSLCCKSKRGVVIFWETDGGFIYSTASNSPPKPFKCDSSQECRAACNKIAVHAEERAIITARCSLRDAHLLHVKTIDNKLVPSGSPSCWQCSRMILEAGIARVWLYGEDGWDSWSAESFHFETLKWHSLPRKHTPIWGR